MQMIKKYPIYGKFMFNNFFSAMGDSMFYIALLTYASQLPNSNLAITMVSLSETIPGIMFIITGNLADMSRNKAKKTMISGVFRGVLYILVGGLIGFKPSMVILTLIVLANFFSDIAGKYASGLLSPFVRFIVSEDDLEEAQGLAGATINLVSLLANFVGAYLIGIFSFRLLAWINSFTFFVVAIVILSMKSLLDNIETREMGEQDFTKEISLATVLNQMKHSYKSIRDNSYVFKVVILFAVANGVLGVLTPLLSLLFSAHPELVINSFPYTLALFQGMIGVGVILGSLFGVKLFKKQGLEIICFLLFLNLFVLILMLLLQQIWLSLFCCFGMGIFVGVASPKLGSLVISQFPVEKIATISGGMNTLLTLIPPIAIVGITSLVRLFNLNVAFIFLGGFIALFALANYFVIVSESKIKLETVAKMKKND